MTTPDVAERREAVVDIARQCVLQDEAPQVTAAEVGAAADDLIAAVRAQVEAEHADDLRHRIEVSQRIEAERRAAEAERDEYHRHWQEALAENRSVRVQVASEVLQCVELGTPEAAAATLTGHTGGCTCGRCGRFRSIFASRAQIAGEIAQELEDGAKSGILQGSEFRDALHVAARIARRVAGPAASPVPAEPETADLDVVLPRQGRNARRFVAVPAEPLETRHRHGSVVEQVHRAFTTDQGVDAWVLAEEIVAFVNRHPEGAFDCPTCAQKVCVVPGCDEDGCVGTREPS